MARMTRKCSAGTPWAFTIHNINLKKIGILYKYSTVREQPHTAVLQPQCQIKVIIIITIIVA